MIQNCSVSIGHSLKIKIPGCLKRKRPTSHQKTCYASVKWTHWCWQIY